MDFLHTCKDLGLETRIARCVLDLEVQEVDEIEGKFLQEYIRLNQVEESGIEKWLKTSKGRDYDGDEVMLEMLVEIYKKLERLEQKFSLETSSLLPLAQRVRTHSIGHGVLCFEEALVMGKTYYGRFDLPVFPVKTVPIFFKMITCQIASIVRMGTTHSQNYDAYVVECERMEIRSKREGEF